MTKGLVQTQLNTCVRNVHYTHAPFDVNTHCKHVHTCSVDVCGCVCTFVIAWLIHLLWLMIDGVCGGGALLTHMYVPEYFMYDNFVEYMWLVTHV